MKQQLVALHMDAGLSYPAAGFDPPERYPEYPHADPGLNPGNRVYAAVRELFRQLRLDEENFGKKSWNPLGRYIRRGDKVAIKPNFVTDRHPAGDSGLTATVTNPSVLRAVLDYALIAAGREGKISVVDAPLDVADFDNVARITGLDSLFTNLREVKGMEVDLHDLRRWRTYWVDTDVRRWDLPGDPQGYVNADLGADSELLRGVDPAVIGNYRSTASYFEKRRMASWHNLERNLYSFSKTVMDADVFINLPKMKTHKKSGVTINLKNIVGVTDAKDTLPHHRVGRPSCGGDDLPDSATWPMKFKAFLVDKVISSPYGLAPYKLIRPVYKQLAKKGAFGEKQHDRGEWYGNDTIWRTTLDLNKVLLYADAQGVLHDRPVRRYFSVVDGIVAGEGNGPLKPSPVACGLLAAGDDPVAVDLVCIRAMGLDWTRIPTYANLANIDRYPLGCVDPTGIEVVSANPGYRELFSDRKLCRSFRPADGWEGAIEL